ncbi:response regulator transcription factor [Dehalogenimonas etheniformans]|uniref:DNA-binding response regulator n=1 Tax=Dehalogenimonas etheniformans TaxID=1536648 RepID=A0A2P5P541_9CHLR|nr:response regulator transcription factor [Dehalogenimonas etheniformans]PPD57405.1 DNA-binding response regulator [Dehalogenimonas etheniformans]QNT77019.1 response regulator transcription factor [Dehalogenimonas etheniformans]
MKVLLVDDNRLMLEGLQNLLDAHGIEVAGVATDGLQSVTQARQLKPDVILMDVRMPKCDGLCATRLIKAEMPEAKIVILTTSTEDKDLFEAVKSGACGYLLKSMDATSLVEALELAAQGIPPFSPEMATKLLDEFARISSLQDAPPTPHLPPKNTPGTRLNARENEVLRMVSEGLTYKEIGSKLSLSPRTIKYHMAEIMYKLHLENRAQVLAYAGSIGMKTEER